MNWTWNLRSSDAGMNGLEFCRSTTAGGLARVLVHAAPGRAELEIRADDDSLVAAGHLDREGDYSPMTLVTLEARAPGADGDLGPPGQARGGGVSGGDGVQLRRQEVWPDEELYGTPVLLAGGEVGILTKWYHAEDHSWWRWSVEFSNHVGRPADWSPPEP